MTALQIAIPPEASIEQLTCDAEWLGSGPEDLFADSGRYHEDATRFATAFVRMEQAGRVADAVLWASRMQGARDHARRWMRARIDRIETQDDQGQDLLFELEIAGRLARWPGLEIELAEPDILIRYPPLSEPLALACKRPRSVRSVGHAVEAARNQIRTHGHPGAIVVGLEAIFHRSDEGARPYVYSLDSPADARRDGDAVANEIASALAAHPDRMFDPRVAGIYLCGLLTYWSRQPSAYGYLWIRKSIPNPEAPGGPEVIDMLNHLLFERVAVG